MNYVQNLTGKMHDKTFMHDLRMKFVKKKKVIIYLRVGERWEEGSCSATHFGCGLAYAIIDVEQWTELWEFRDENTCVRCDNCRWNIHET